MVDSRRFRILAVIGDFSRECLGLVGDNSLSGIRVARELGRIAELRRYHCLIVSSDGTELTSNAILRRVALHRARQTDAEWRAESFIGSLRDERLNEHLFRKPDRSAPHHRTLAPGL